MCATHTAIYRHLTRNEYKGTYITSYLFLFLFLFDSVRFNSLLRSYFVGVLAYLTFSNLYRTTPHNITIIDLSFVCVKYLVNKKNEMPFILFDIDFERRNIERKKNSVYR